MKTYDPKERAREKELSRERDQQDLASGRKTQEQLRRENGVFVFPNARIDFGEIMDDDKMDDSNDFDDFDENGEPKRGKRGSEASS